MDLLWKKYISYWKTPVLWGIWIGLVATISKLSISVFVGKLIDLGVLERDYKSLMTMILSIFLYGILGSILWLVSKIMFQKAAYRTGKQMRLDLYDHMNQMSLEDLEKIGWETMADLMSEDTECIENFIRQMLPRMFYLIFSIVGSIVVVAKMHPILGSIYFFVMCVVLGLMLNMSSMPQGKKRDNIRALSGGIIALSFPVFLCLCLIWIDKGEFTIGNAVTFFLYWYPVRKIGMLLERMQRSREEYQVASRRMESSFEMHTKIKEGTVPFSTHSEINTPQIVFQNVNFSKGKQKIVQDFNLEVSSGECIGIVADEKQGELLSYFLPRYYEPTSGIIQIDGLDITQYTFQDLRNQIGIIGQEDRMYIGNFYENLITGNPNAQMDDIEKALYAAGLLNTVEKLQRGLRTPIWKKDERVLEQRMFCVARMLLKEPSILILNHLWEGCADSKLEISMMLERVKEAYPYITILLIDSHEENLTGCDQVVSV